jgi:hypothetical protein
MEKVEPERQALRPSVMSVSVTCMVSRTCAGRVRCQGG